MKVGDTIRADMGGGMFANGTIDSIAFGKVRVKLPAGHIVEVDQKREHQINGRKPLNPVEAVRKLRELDKVTNLSDWEMEFVGDLLQTGQRTFSDKQEAMIDLIYRRRVDGDGQ